MHSKSLPCTVSSQLHSNTMKWALLSSPWFYKRENGGIERLGNLSKGTSLIMTDPGFKASLASGSTLWPTAMCRVHTHRKGTRYRRTMSSRLEGPPAAEEYPLFIALYPSWEIKGTQLSHKPLRHMKSWYELRKLAVWTARISSQSSPIQPTPEEELFAILNSQHQVQTIPWTLPNAVIEWPKHTTAPHC